MPKNGAQRADNWKRLNEIFEAAVELPFDDQERFLDRSCLGDSKLRAEVGRLLNAARKIGQNDFLSSDAFQIGARVIAQESAIGREQGKMIGRFRIASEIAQGGMGVVYLAERDDFKQRVALKLIRSGLDSAAIVRRFRIERDVLASLNHPNIARLLDGGTTEDGQPFLAIEYVEGERIDRYCDNHNLNLKQRLELFRKVSAAVAYAHQNLTVHRDLKPSNILVTADGEPKLLDFGIAKILANTAPVDETATADRLLTPEYASPEQLLGRKITTASDVYSLGVLLYELLTGTRPFELRNCSPFEIVDAVCNTEPPAPSSRSSHASRAADTHSPTPYAHVVEAAHLKGDLDNIILTALRKDPERRYSSVEQFSEDVRRYLDGLPVIARPTTFKYRAGKFVRRNRLAVAFASLAILALVVGAAGATWQAIVARNEAARAKQRFDEVRALANTFVSDWHEGIRENSIPPEVRARLANISSDYLTKLAADTDDPEVLREAAAAQIKLGHEYAYFMIDLEKARASFRNAEQIARKLYAADPGDKSARSLLVLSLMKYTEFFGPEDINASIASRREQIGLRELNLSEQPDDVTELRDLAILHEQTGNDLKRIDRRDQAQEHFARSDELHERRIRIVANLPETAENAARLSGSLSMRAWNLSENLENRASAFDHAERSIQTAAAGLAKFPGDRGLNIALVSAQFDFGLLLRNAGEHRRAIDVFRASISSNEAFGENRTDGYFNRREADAYLNIGYSWHAIGDDQVAHEAVRRFIDIRREWTSRNARLDLPRTFVAHASLMELAGRLLVATKRPSEAEDLFEEAGQFLDRVPDDARHDLTKGRQRASLMLSRGDAVSGLNACQRILESWAPVDPSCASRSIVTDKQRVARARELYKKSLEIISSLPALSARTDFDVKMRLAAESRMAAVQ